MNGTAAVSNDAIVSAESVLSGGLQPLHVLKAFNPPSQLAEPPSEEWEDVSSAPCDAFHFLFALPRFPCLAQGHLGNTFKVILLPPSKPHSKY